MIIIGGDMKINPDHRNAAVQTFIKMAKASQAEEGCIVYEFSADLEADDTFHLFEVWEDEETLAAHGRTSHMAEFRQEIGKYRLESNIKRYRAELA